MFKPKSLASFITSDSGERLEICKKKDKEIQGGLLSEIVFGRKYLLERKLKEGKREAEVFTMHLLIPEDRLNELLKQDWVKESLDPILKS